MKVKFISAVLCMLMLANVCVSCGSGDNGEASGTTADGTDSGAAETSAPPKDSLEARKLVDDGLPEKDFGGRSFMIVTNDYMETDYMADEINGDIINDAVFSRNQTVEDRFNIKLEDYAADYNTVSGYITTNVLSGDDSIQLISEHVVALSGVALQDLFLDWYKLPHIDFDKPWWSPSTKTNLTYDGKALLAIGDVALASIGKSCCIFFNKKFAEDYKLDNPYDVVNDGRWTIDYLISITKNIYKDLNSSGARDYSDFYGYMSDSATNLDAYLWAFDNPVFKPQGGKQVYCYKTEKVTDIVSKLINMFEANDGIYTDNIYVGKVFQGIGLSGDMFEKAHCVFANATLDLAITQLRDLDDDYGILPYPKWDEKQDDYYTMVDGSYAAMAVPKSVADTDYVGTIIEALCAESYKTVVPAYYDTALKVKLTRDDESVGMIEKIVDSRIFDFGYAYDNWKGPSFIIESLVRDRDPNFESYYVSKEKQYEEHYKEVTDLFDNLK